MARIIDLSIPIEDTAGRLGLNVGYKRVATFNVIGWQGTSFSMFAHYASHVDAPLHFIKDGHSIDTLPLDHIVGPAVMIDLTQKGGGDPIKAADLDPSASRVRERDIVILRTDWSDKTWGTPAFFGNSPYLTDDAADWLVKKKVHAVVYDFSEEYAVRKPGFTGEDCTVHRKILGNGIYNIEYVHNLGAIKGERTTIVALPLLLVGIEGAPARVIALED